MTAKIIFNIDQKLKDAAQKKARKEGLTLSAVLNFATEAYVKDRLKIIAFDRDLALAMQQLHEE
jgi:hypothetical protein